MKKVFVLILILSWLGLANAATYFVDATDGDDAKDGLSEANAWQTIAKVEASAGDGDTVQFQRGETWTGRLDVPASNMTFTDYGSGNLPIIDGGGTESFAIDVIGKTSVIIEYIQAQDVSAAGATIRLSGCTTCIIRTCTVYKGGTTASSETALIAIVGAGSGNEVHNNTLGKNTGDPVNDKAWSAFQGIIVRGEDILVYENTINHTTSEGGDANHFYADGIAIDTISGTTEIYDNTVYHTGSHGIYFKQTTGAYILKIYGNTLSYNGQAGISIYECWAGGTGYIYENTVSYCDRTSGTSGSGGNSSCGIHLNNGYTPGGAFDTWYVYDNIVHHCQAPNDTNNEDSGGYAIDYNADGVYMYRNIGYDNYGKALYVYNADDAKVFYNIFWGNDSGIIVSTTGNGQTADDNLIYGNTLYKNYNGAPGPDYDTEILFGLNGNRNLFKNNIVYADDNGWAYYFYLEGSSDCVTDYNIVYKDSGNPCYDTDNGSQTYAQWRTNHATWDANSVNDNPDMNDPGNDDFTLTSVSPAIDDGVDLGNDYDEIIDPSSSWPSSVSILDQDDFGTAWDMGAFVYQHVVTITATDSAASEEGPATGTFRMTRTGSTSGNLVVSFTLGGTAGVGDYDEDLSGGSLTILDGNATVDQTITPTDDSDVEGQETLTMTLASDGYYIGSPSQSTIYIGDNESVEGEAGLVVFAGGGTGALTKDLAGSGSLVRQ